tara:strand:+ start:627 stop:899 length:273 start_codon:yes stop_codon:yes gene_type:complete
MVRFLFILPPLARGYGTPQAPERVDFKIFSHLFMGRHHGQIGLAGGEVGGQVLTPHAPIRLHTNGSPLHGARSKALVQPINGLQQTAAAP